MEYVIDGEHKVLGRLSSPIAKMLLNGNTVNVVNAEKIVISGHRKDMLEEYKRRIELRDKANPEHSPYISRRPDLLVKRTIRGMLPYRKPKGKSAYKRLRVYMGVPEGLKGSEAYDIKAKASDELYENSITVRELANKLGYKV